MITYLKNGLRVGELWFDESVNSHTNLDIILLQQYSSVGVKAKKTNFQTLELDLLASVDALFDGMDSSTRYKVRRARNKDGVLCVCNASTSESLCSEFIAFYNQFASVKSIPKLISTEVIGRARGGILRFSQAILEGKTIVWHVHALVNNRASLLYSASSFRNFDDNDSRAVMGRANRLLHWEEILAFKAEGALAYDFGGWYSGSDDQALLGINRFKEGFGGKRIDQINALIPVTWRGAIYIKLREALSGRQRMAISKVIRVFG